MKTLRKQRDRLNNRRNAMSVTMKNVKNPAAYKVPGSMKKS